MSDQISNCPIQFWNIFKSELGREEDLNIKSEIRLRILKNSLNRSEEILQVYKLN